MVTLHGYHDIRNHRQHHCVFNTLLTHWGRVTHIYVGNLTIIGSDNGLSPDRRQAIICPNVGILLIGPLGTNFSEMLIEIHTFSLKKIRLKMSSAKCCSFRFGLNVLKSTRKQIQSSVLLTIRFPSQGFNDAKGVFMSWRLHEFKMYAFKHI